MVRRFFGGIEWIRIKRVRIGRAGWLVDRRFLHVEGGGEFWALAVLVNRGFADDWPAFHRAMVLCDGQAVQPARSYELGPAGIIVSPGRAQLVRVVPGVVPDPPGLLASITERQGNHIVGLA